MKEDQYLISGVCFRVLGFDFNLAFTRNVFASCCFAIEAALSTSEVWGLRVVKEGTLGQFCVDCCLLITRQNGVHTAPYWLYEITFMTMHPTDYYEISLIFLG